MESGDMEIRRYMGLRFIRVRGIFNRISVITEENHKSRNVFQRKFQCPNSDPNDIFKNLMYINRGCGNSTRIVHDVKVHLIVPDALVFVRLAGGLDPRSLVQHIMIFFFVHIHLFKS